MIPSVRNAEAGHLHVLENANCKKIFHSEEYAKLATSLQTKKIDLETFTVPALDPLIDATPKHFAYNKRWESSWKEPVIIAHSSHPAATAPAARHGQQGQPHRHWQADSLTSGASYHRVPLVRCIGWVQISTPRRHLAGSPPTTTTHNTSNTPHALLSEAVAASRARRQFFDTARLALSLPRLPLHPT